MISKQAVEEQLKRIGCNFRFWGRSEVNELGRILMDDEIIAECVNGEYGNGFALLVATNHRLLLVDKKPLLYLTVEDYRYEMITEFSLNHRMLDAAIHIHTTNKTMSFNSWNQHRLRRLLEYVQARVLEMRQQEHMASQFTAATAAQMAQMYAAAQAQSQQPAIAAPVQHQALPDSHYAALPAHAQPDQPSPAPTGYAPQPQQPTPEQPSQSSPQATTTGSRWANSRAILGTYTRSKLPSSFRRPASEPDQVPDNAGGSFGGQAGIGRFGISYDFES